jgi:IS605 OrfB family transposase
MDDDVEFKTYKILLKPTPQQKRKLNTVWYAYKYTYNECVRYLYEINRQIKLFKKQHPQQPYTELESYEFKELLFKQNEKRIRNDLVTEKKNPYFTNIKNRFLLKTAKTIRQQAVFECVYRYKTLKQMRLQNKLKFFVFKKKRDDNRKTRSINLEKSNIKYDNSTESLKIYINGREDKEYEDGEWNYFKRKQNKRILESEMKTQSKLQITPTGKYYLLLTIKEKKKEYKNMNKQNVVSIDPGIRTFYTCYDMDRVYKLKGDFKTEQQEQDYLKRILKDEMKIKEWYRIKKRKELNNQIYKTIEENIEKGEEEIELKVEEVKTRIGKPEILIKTIKKEIRKRIQKIEEKMKNKRKEFGHKVSKFLVDKYETIVLATLNVKEMVKKKNSKLRTKTRRDFLSIGHTQVISKIREKAKRCGTRLLEVNERYTSKTCGRCGYVKRDLGGSEWYKCNKCKVEMCRDVNGARNILLRSLGVLE